jgi:hypothetical protein
MPTANRGPAKTVTWDACREGLRVSLWPRGSGGVPSTSVIQPLCSTASPVTLPGRLALNSNGDFSFAPDGKLGCST